MRRDVLRPAFSLLSLALLASCGAKPQPVAITEAAAGRDASGALKLTWTTSKAKAPVDVFIVQPNGARALVSGNDKDSVFALDAKEAARRPILELETKSGAKRAIAERVLPLQGGRNFRDLGGYQTAGGETVRWGLLFRSGTMTNLTPYDDALLKSLGIQTICDLRATQERQSEPTDWAAIDTKITYQVRDYEPDQSALGNLMNLGAQVTPQQTKDAMKTLYRALPYEHADSYRVMFRDIVHGRLPLAFNCSAGKDRTGVGAALILSALGVPRKTILEDYALSEKVVNYEKALAPQVTDAKAKPAAQSGFGKLVATMNPEQRAPMFRSDPVYLEAALDEIARREGSVDKYFSKVLGLSAADLTTIRARLLEPNY